MAKFEEGDMVRHLQTKECGMVKRSFSREGQVWYEVLGMATDTREDWLESEVMEENDVSY